MVEIRYLGVACFEIATEKGTKILIDPYITKNKDCPIKIDDIIKVDLILVTHGSFDHLGDTVLIAEKTGALVLSGADVNMSLGEQGLENIRQGNLGQTKEIKGIKVRFMEAKHSSRVTTSKGVVSGLPFSFVITTEDGTRIYHSGDTTIFGDMKLIGELCRPHVALFGMSALTGYTPDLTPAEAALAIQWIGPDVVVPMHYEKGSKDVEAFFQCLRFIAPLVNGVDLSPG